MNSLRPRHLLSALAAGGTLVAAFFVLSGSPVLSSGGASVEFNGANSILVAPSTPSLTLTSDFTLEAWVKILQEPAPNQSYVLVSKWEPTQNKRSYLWLYQTTASGVKQLTLCTSQAGSSFVCAAVNTGFTPLADLGENEWHHVAARFTDTSPGQAALFVDGQNLGGGTTLPVPAANDSPFTIGAVRTAGGNVVLPCSCRMDEVRVWNVARSEMEIIRDRATELSGGEAGLAGYWRFNNDFKDSSPNHNDLTAGNASFSSDSAPLEPDLDLVLFGQEEVRIEKEGQVSSGSVASNANLAIEKDAIVNGDLFADKITIDKNTVINGSASYNKLTTHKEAQVLGSKTSPLSLPLFTLPPVPDFQAGNQDFKFEGQDNTLVPGSYRNVTVGKGSRLNILGGIYNLQSLTLKENATLLLKALEARVIDTFEFLALGPLKSQDGWIFSSAATPNFVVQDEVVSEGRKAVKGSCTAPCPTNQNVGKSIPSPTNVGRSIEPITDTTNFTTISFDLRVESGDGLVVGTDTAFRTVFIVMRRASGDFVLFNGVGPGGRALQLIADPQLATWYHFDVHIDLEHQRVRARVDNGPWSSFINFNANFRSVDHVFLRVGTSPIPTQVDTTAYFDNIFVTVQKPSPAIVNVQRELKSQERVAILEDAGLAPQDLLINYIGRDPQAEAGEDDDDGDDIKPALFGKRSFLNLKLMAPEASVQIGEETTLRGKILARKVRVGKGTVMSIGQAAVKIAQPSEIITDPGGGVYPINTILVSLLPGATTEDALKMTQAVNGRIVGEVSSINLYQVEVQTRTIEELEALIAALRGRTDLKVDGVFRDYLISIQ